MRDRLANIMFGICITAICCLVGCEDPDKPAPKDKDIIYDTFYIESTELPCYIKWFSEEDVEKWELDFSMTDRRSGRTTYWKCFWVVEHSPNSDIPVGIYNIPSYWELIYDLSRGKQMLVLPIPEYGPVYYDAEAQAKGGTVNVIKREDDYYEIEFKLNFGREDFEYVYTYFKGTVEMHGLYNKDIL